MKVNNQINSLNQVQLLSVNTSVFYSEDEQVIADKMLPLYLRRKELNEKINNIKMSYKKSIKNEKNDDVLAELKLAHLDDLANHKSNLKQVNKDIKTIKDNELHPIMPNVKGIRTLDYDRVTYELKNENKQPTGKREYKSKAIISMFESELTRTLGVEANQFTDSLIVVEEVYSDISKQLVTRGFNFNNNLYRYYTSSAGQIRTKKLVFIRKDLWDLHNKTLMCGLTREIINERDGCNINKYLAYLALQASASVRFEGFDINRVVVCDDLELDVWGEVDYIDNKTFTIESKKRMPISMTPTDGSGMCLPSVSELSFQFRAPWMKGLISPFDFKQWVIEMRAKYPDNKKIGFVKDIWNREYDVATDNIELILCKSMLKMYKYYNSWDDYKKEFINNQCHAAICQVESKKEKFGNVKLGYQMLQNLPNLSDKELRLIAQKSINTINRIGRDKDVMLKILGVTPENENKNYFQQAIELVPELLSDTYSKESIRSVKKSIVKNSKAGKVEVDGKYLFAVPDWWAYCEWLMMHKDKDDLEGLLQGEEVYSKFFKDGEKLDLLRSPSLYREHGIRVNKVNKLNKKWLISNGVYIGHKSLLAKLLMLDYDGDQILCVCDESLVSAAEKQMKGIVPLHYELAKSEPSIINDENLYEGLKKAFGVKIGTISNSISIVWNRENPDMDVLKWLCLINNEVIDYAKTLHKSTIPPKVKERIKAATKGLLPHLFVYAKKKKECNVETDQTNSVMNRLARMIPNTNIYFKKVVGNLDHTILMKNKDIVLDDKVIELYKSVDKVKKWTMDIQSNDKESSGDNLVAYSKIRNQFAEQFEDINHVVDVLIRYLYVEKDSNWKTTLWSSFGDVIIENIKRNQFENSNFVCEDCSKKFTLVKQRQVKCDECLKVATKLRKKINKRNERKMSPRV